MINSYFEVVWRQGSTISETVNSYKKYVKRNYGKATIVFDGYSDTPSTKDHEHQRQSLKSSNSPEVKVTMATKIHISQSSFLANDLNKMALVKILMEELRKDGCKVRKVSPDNFCQTVIRVLKGNFSLFELFPVTG